MDKWMDSIIKLDIVTALSRLPGHAAALIMYTNPPDELEPEFFAHICRVGRKIVQFREGREHELIELHTEREDLVISLWPTQNKNRTCKAAKDLKRHWIGIQPTRAYNKRK